LVICDDVSFDPGVLRIRKKGSAGGHNGLKSIIAHIGDGFPRIKMGVGKKPEGYDMADFVLGRFGKEDGEKMKEAAKNAAEAAALYVGGKADEAMNRFSK
jgi:PTH1 family peptidyl-tRNA hydrolase